MQLLQSPYTLTPDAASLPPAAGWMPAAVAAALHPDTSCSRPRRLLAAQRTLHHTSPPQPGCTGAEMLRCRAAHAVAARGHAGFASGFSSSPGPA